MATTTAPEAGAPKTGAMAERARMLHTMLRVYDLDKSLDFYCNKLGLVEHRRRDSEVGRYTLVFLVAPEDKGRAIGEASPLIELTYNWGKEEPYDMGNAFGHFAIGVDDVYAACEEIEAKGCEIPRPAGPMKGTDTVIAFVKDPDGYMIELIENSRFQ